MTDERKEGQQDIDERNAYTGAQIEPRGSEALESLIAELQDVGTALWRVNALRGRQINSIAQRLAAATAERTIEGQPLREALEWIANFSDEHMSNAETLHYAMRSKAKLALADRQPASAKPEAQPSPRAGMITGLQVASAMYQTIKELGDGKYLDEAGNPIPGRCKPEVWYAKIAEHLNVALAAATAERTPTEQRQPLGFHDALDLVRDGYRAWSLKPHNAKWVKRIDGTPIENDLLVNIAEVLADYRLTLECAATAERTPPLPQRWTAIAVAKLLEAKGYAAIAEALNDNMTIQIAAAFAADRQPAPPQPEAPEKEKR